MCDLERSIGQAVRSLFLNLGIPDRQPAALNHDIIYPTKLLELVGFILGRTILSIEEASNLFFSHKVQRWVKITCQYLLNMLWVSKGHHRRNGQTVAFNNQSQTSGRQIGRLSCKKYFAGLLNSAQSSGLAATNSSSSILRSSIPRLEAWEGCSMIKVGHVADSEKA